MQIVKLKLTLKLFLLKKLKQFAGMRKNDYLCSGKTEQRVGHEVPSSVGVGI